MNPTDSQWHSGEHPPPPWAENKSIDVPAAIIDGGDFYYAFAQFDYLRGVWRVGPHTVNVVFWFALPPLPEQRL